VSNPTGHLKVCFWLPLSACQTNDKNKPQFPILVINTHVFKQVLRNCWGQVKQFCKSNTSI